MSQFENEPDTFVFKPVKILHIELAKRFECPVHFCITQTDTLPNAALHFRAQFFIFFSTENTRSRNLFWQMDETTFLAQKNTGWIEVIAGCMFSGKTEELIRRIRRAQIARQKVMIFKPRIDNRYSTDHIVSHSEQSLVSTVVDTPEEVLRQSTEAQVVGIDEGQFFSAGIVDVCEQLANGGKRVIVAGLDQDYRGKPFEPMPQLLAIAEYITKTLAICVVCGNPADRTQRTSNSHERVVVGAKDAYEARCRHCFNPPKD